MDEDSVRKAQGSRLRAIRVAAGYASGRSAALEAGWPESTYNAHEGGRRTIDPQDAARYALWFLQNGAPRGQNYTGRWIIYGDEEELTGADFEDLVRNESAAFRKKAYQVIMDLKKR